MAGWEESRLPFDIYFFPPIFLSLLFYISNSPSIKRGCSPSPLPPISLAHFPPFFNSPDISPVHGVYFLIARMLIFDDQWRDRASGHRRCGDGTGFGEIFSMLFLAFRKWKGFGRFCAGGRGFQIWNFRYPSARNSLIEKELINIRFVERMKRLLIMKGSLRILSLSLRIIPSFIRITFQLIDH